MRRKNVMSCLNLALFDGPPADSDMAAGPLPAIQEKR